jgi:hypothetical protein
MHEVDPHRDCRRDELPAPERDPLLASLVTDLERASSLAAIEVATPAFLVGCNGETRPLLTGSKSRCRTSSRPRAEAPRQRRDWPELRRRHRPAEPAGSGLLHRSARAARHRRGARRLRPRPQRGDRGDGWVGYGIQSVQPHPQNEDSRFKSTSAHRRGQQQHRSGAATCIRGRPASRTGRGPPSTSSAIAPPSPPPLCPSPVPGQFGYGSHSVSVRRGGC